MLIALIVGCEVAFWAFLFAGLAIRYVARRRTAGAIVLTCVPLVDVVLLVASIIHLRQGGSADQAVGLAAAYIGVSVAFGPSSIKRMDARFAHRFAGGPPAPKPPKYGRDHAHYEWRLFLRAVLAWAVSCALLLAGTTLVEQSEGRNLLIAWITKLTTILAIWFLIAASYQVWPRKVKEPKG